MTEQKTTAQPKAQSTKVPVKFNKETKELTLEEASVLAQKGLKFEAIEKDYNLLKSLAAKENKSVPAFISDLAEALKEDKQKKLTEKCGGDKEFAEHIMELEGEAEKDLKLREVTESFDKINSLSDLPESVVENAKLKGTFLLDEYLRYLLNENKKAKEAGKNQKSAEAKATGSLANQRGAADPETEGFLSGLWS